MNERPEIYFIKNDCLTLKRRSFRGLVVAAGLILAVGITGLTLSGCSGSGDAATTSGGTTTSSGYGATIRADGGTFNAGNTVTLGDLPFASNNTFQ